MTSRVSIIPSPEPIPLPAPVWLLQALLFLTFVIHLVFMNMTVGGLLYLARSELSRRVWEPMQRWVTGYLPVTTAFTITSGVAPLLFLQVVYGQLFFPAAIMIAWAWLLVIFALLAGYYGVYAYALASDRLGRWRGWVIVGSTVLFLYIAFAFSNVITLMSTPFRWWEIWQEHPPSISFNLNWWEPTLLPRFLHFVLGATAFFGLVTALYGVAILRKQDAAAAQQMHRIGVAWFIVPTVLNYLVGPLFLFMHERPVWQLFVGANLEATGLLWGSVALSLLALLCAAVSLRSPSPLPWLLAALSTMSLTVIGMAGVRFWVRSLLISLHAPEVRLAELPVEPQWGILVIFVAVLLIGLGLVVWMVRQMLRYPAAQPTQRSEP